MKVAIRFALRNPICLGKHGFLTLDGLCTGIQWHRHRNPKTVNDVPLVRRGDLWLASSGVLEAPSIPERVTFTQSTGRMLMLTGCRYVPKGRARKIKLGSGKYQNVMSSYTTHAAPGIWFLCQTPDAKELRDFFKEVYTIGALRQKGFGLIDDIEIVEVENDLEFFGAVDATGQVARPVPREMVGSVGGTADTYACVSWYNPYHETPQADCGMPSKTVMTDQEIDQWAGF